MFLICYSCQSASDENRNSSKIMNTCFMKAFYFLAQTVWSLLDASENKGKYPVFQNLINYWQREKCPELINLMFFLPFVPGGFRCSGSCFSAGLLSSFAREKINIPASQLLISVWTGMNQLLSWRKWNINWHEENVLPAAAEAAMVVKSWFLSLQRPVFWVTSSY